MQASLQAAAAETVLPELAPLHRLLAVVVHGDADAIGACLRGRQVAMLVGFGSQDQARIATAVSEVVRGLASRPAGGVVDFLVGQSGRRRTLVVTLDGAGAPRAEELAAARRFVDRCDSAPTAAGMRIVLTKHVPSPMAPLEHARLDAAVAGLAPLPGNVALAEARQQNRELTDALAALQAKQDELVRISADLERTNRQVAALNVLLDDKATSLVSADRRKDEFLSVLSHELRGPLAAASMASQLLEQNPDRDHQSVRLGQLIGRQVRHMSRMVEDLLDVSRVARGLVSIERRPIDMREVVEAALEQVAAAAQAKGHAVTLAPMPEACTVDGDRTRLLQVTANLLANAVRYTPDGGAILVELARHGQRVVLRVSDDGIGIPAGLMPHLFDLYTQAAQSSGGEGGLGLGLALVKSLVEAHQGSVTAASAGEGRGSRFEVSLPALA